MEVNFTCPAPLPSDDRVLLAHGGGGRLSHQLLETLFLKAFSNPALEQRHDGAVVTVDEARLAFTTDSYVVRPLFFPGGNIGDLAVYGTVNDLAMCGARPLYLSCGFILEEGFPMVDLRAIVDSMREAACRAGVALVTGDTKVVDRGKGDGVFINTAGIGLVVAGAPVGPSQVRPGDAIIVSGDLGSHGMAILCVREGLEFETSLRSDTAPLWEPVEALLEAGLSIHCLRDLTRGGLSSALNEIAAAVRAGIAIEEAAIPIEPAVQAACEVLGLDPLYVANEGRFAVFLPSSEAVRALDILKRFPVCSRPAQIGVVETDNPGTVLLRSRAGGNRVLDMLSGEQLPRIC